MCPQKKKSSGLKCGEQGGQATGLPRPIHRAGSTRASCLGDLLRRQVQNYVRGNALEAFRLYSFLPFRVECDPMFHANYCSSGWVLSPLLFYKNNLDSPCICLFQHHFRLAAPISMKLGTQILH
ncbi:hypothetical protein AVEN_161537-1 [Araneus ventricosus]|uniref:Uncharacterized protein n=1 Tax=Araneus ventricosus TaxID=182803 RepID=A0A4Y2DHE9_ARAVE|nr:hypothetical protein AVEN_6344-1 [Araneus ventricosus]GBM16211.1 hypothetical protein AVEN_101120-1 [Araneus ventricosus]GBM16220.1 hypothetical protein AVEN_104194-1 [Araneus ventricosus]GBM16337.1 hypothetical protein AVEN_161537-1 [Araneus ventricosus]